MSKFVHKTGNLKISEYVKKKKSKTETINEMDLPTPISEQEKIINAVKNGQNVIVDANPGVGKTTTSLNIAKDMPDNRITLITFNKSLKHDVRLKTVKYKLTSLSRSDVHSYHSFALSNYGVENAFTDEGIRVVVENDIAPVKDISFDLVIVDEAHDMKEVYCMLIIKILKDIREEVGAYPQLLIFGDKNQCVYEFIGSRIAYMTLANHIFKDHEFEKYSLTVTHRLTGNIATFVNKYLLGKDLIVSAKKAGPKVNILTTNPFIKNSHYAIAINIWKNMKEHNLKDGDVAILSPSLYNKSGLKGNQMMIHALENLMTSKGHTVYYPTSDDTELDEKVIKGHMVFSTFPTSKGREWKMVVVIGANGEYSSFFDNRIDKISTPPSPVYVAYTRASLILTAVMWGTNPPWEKIPRSELFHTPFSELIEGEKEIEDSPFKEQSKTQNKVSVTRLCAYIPEKLHTTITNELDPFFIEKRECSDIIKIPTTIKVKKEFDVRNKKGEIINNIKYHLYEHVADKSGEAILHIYDIKTQPKGSKTYLSTRISEILSEDIDNPYRKLLYQHCGSKVLLNNNRKITAASSIVSHYDLHTLASPTNIDSFSWITTTHSSLCIERLSEIMKLEKSNIEREVSLIYKHEWFTIPTDEEKSNIDVVGRIDILSNERLWEIKVVSSISLEHKLQLLVYSWLWRKLNPDSKRHFYLFNVRTGQILKYIGNSEFSEKIVEMLLNNFVMKNASEPEEVTLAALNKYRRIVGY